MSPPPATEPAIGVAWARRLVAREHELQLLAHAVSRGPAVALVEGEAGVGKSRLIEELQRLPEVPRLLIGRCVAQSHPFPLLPVLEAIRHGADAFRGSTFGPLAGALRPLLPDLADHLPPRPELLGDPRADLHQVFCGIRELLTAAGPMILALDDLHWAEDSTIELLHFLAAQPPPQLRMVLAYRRDEIGADSGLLSLPRRAAAGCSCTRIEVPPLSPEGVRALVDEMLTVQASGDFATFVHERTAGLPFAVEEFLQLLADRQDLLHVGGRWVRRQLSQLPAPAGVRDAVGARIARLSPDARGVIAAAAVLDDGSIDILHRVFPVPADAFQTAMDEAQQSGLIRLLSFGRYEFRHTLARQSAYETTPALEREDLHRRAFAVLREQGGADIRLAIHARDGGLIQEWIHFGQAAASTALELFDDDGAGRLLLDLLATPDLDPPTQVALATQLGRAVTGCRWRRDAIAAMRDVLDRHPANGGRVGELRYLLARVLHYLGDMVAAREQARAALDDGLEGELAARAMLILGWPMSPEGTLAEHDAWLAQVTETARSSSGEMRDVVLTNAAAGRIGIGDPATASLAEELLRVSDVAEQRRYLSRCHTNVAELAIYSGQYGIAGRSLDLARELWATSDEGGELYEAPWWAVRSLLDLMIGQWDGLEERASAAADALAGEAADELMPRLVLACLRCARQGLASGQPLLEDVVERGESVGFVPGTARAAAELAMQHLAYGNPIAARDALEPALVMLQRKQIWAWGAEIVPAAVRVLITLEDRAAAASLVIDLEAGIADRDAPASLAGLKTSTALLAEAAGDLSLAANEFEQARSLWADLPRPYEAARVVADCARVHLRMGRRTTGIELLRSALDEFVRLDARIAAVETRRVLREAETTTAPVVGVGPWATLSAREAQLARLAAAGLSSREMSDHLFLSPRTVDNHLWRAMQKLGVHSRGELGRFATETLAE